MAEISSAAQAIMDAYIDEDRAGRIAVAAVLRSVADQVVPQSEIAPQRNLEDGRESMMWGMGYQTQVTRHSILAIATELESAQ